MTRAEREQAERAFCETWIASGPEKASAGELLDPAEAAKLPIFGKTLHARQTSLGRWLEGNSGYPIAREADRLREAGFEVSFGTPKRRPFEPTSALREREEQFAVEFSDAARRLIEHPLYDEYVDVVKAAALTNLARYLRERTTKEMRDRTIENIIINAAKGVARRQKRQEEE